MDSCCQFYEAHYLESVIMQNIQGYLGGFYPSLFLFCSRTHYKLYNVYYTFYDSSFISNQLIINNIVNIKIMSVVNHYYMEGVSLTILIVSSMLWVPTFSSCYSPKILIKIY